MSAFTRRLELFGALPTADKLLLATVAARGRTIPAYQEIVRLGDVPANLHIVMQGTACRYRILPSGTRRILAVMVPGDLCDLSTFSMKARADCSLGTLTPCVIADVSAEAFSTLMERPAIVRAFEWAKAVDEAVMREWLISAGRRNAEQRLAHLLCELYYRLASVGSAGDGGFELALRPPDLADALGLSTIHVNRSFHSLRSRNLVTQAGQSQLTILNLVRLREDSGFSPSYLRLGGEHGHGEAEIDRVERLLAQAPQQGARSDAHRLGREGNGPAGDP